MTSHASASGSPASSLRFVGRRQELDLLRRRIRDASSGAASVCVLAGPAGIGKSRLLAEVERAGPERFLRLSCFANVGSSPDALRDLIRELDPAGGVPPTDVSMGALFAEVLRHLRAAATARTYVLVIEDLQWADPGTQAFVDYLVDVLRVVAENIKLCVILTLREDSAVEANLTDFVAGLMRASREFIRLAPLSSVEMTGALAAFAFDRDIELRIETLSGGNPLFLEELARDARDHRVASIPPSIQLVFRSSLVALSPAARRLVYAASILGVRFTLETLTALGEAPEADLPSLLQEGSDARVIAPDDVPATYRFRHALIREAIYRELIPENAARLHALAARAIASRGEWRRRTYEIAWHCERAGWSSRACRFYRAAGSEAERIRDFESAARAYERAYSTAPSDPELRANLAAAKGRALAGAGQLDGAIAATGEAAAHFRAAHRIDAAMEQLRDRAVFLVRSGRRRAAIAELDSHLREVRKSAPALAEKIVRLGATFAVPGGVPFRAEREKWLARLARLRPAETATGKAEEEVLRAVTEIFDGNWRDGLRHFEHAVETARRSKAADYDFHITMTAANYQRYGGATASAFKLYRYAYNLAQRESNTWMLHYAGSALGRLLILSGALGEAREILEHCVETSPPNRTMRVALAGNAILIGVLQNDASLVEHFLDARLIELALESEATGMLGDIAFACVLALRARGDVDAARDLVARVLPRLQQPWEAQPFLAMVPLWGSSAEAQRAVTLLSDTSHTRVPGSAAYRDLSVGYASLTTRRDAAAAQASNAARQFRRMGLGLLSAFALELAQRQPEALAAYERMGDTYDAARLSGVRLEGDRLTVRQRQIAELVVSGYTNREIAERLGIAGGTVGVHLHAVFRELGVASRAQLVAALVGAGGRGVAPKETL